MIDTLYIEEEAYRLPRTEQILRRFPKARKIIIGRYGEVLNPKSQNFRLQKNHPALILAVKHDGYLLPAPPHYGIGGKHNYYFSHMMNCVYDCRYCFLQGMYRSANYVLFINYEDFFTAIEHQQTQLNGQAGWYFSGYDCDSLALEPITHFVDFALEQFENKPGSWLELRTKSTQIRHILKREAFPHCVVAFSLSPDSVVESLEHKTPSLAKRLQAARVLTERGWPIGLRFDPIIATEHFTLQYKQLFEQTFRTLPETAIHSVSLGPFRLPRPFYKNIIKLYPEEALFATELQTRDDDLVSYDTTNEQEMLRFCRNSILQFIPESKFFPCVEMAY